MGVHQQYNFPEGLNVLPSHITLTSSTPATAHGSYDSDHRLSVSAINDGESTRDDIPLPSESEQVYMIDQDIDEFGIAGRIWCI